MQSALAKQIALVVVDMQAPFLKAIRGSGQILERCRFTLEAAQLLGMRILFTEQVTDKLGHTDKRLLDLAPKARVLAKTTFSAFGAEGFADELRANSIRHILLAGIETPICIYNTAIQASSQDMEVTLLEDCIGARRPKDAKTVLRFLCQKSDCHVLPSETIFYCLLNDAMNPLFREFTHLVKKYS